nr:nucleotide-binding alpha-beta plait domain-containing protein [Tanacetum cinerariifolium]
SLELWNMTGNKRMTVQAHDTITSALAQSHVTGMVCKVGYTNTKGEEKRKFVPCRNVVNFFFTNFPSEWNTANLLELFEEVGEVADVYAAKKMSKVGQKFGFARFYRVGNLQALENRLNRIRIGRFKLRANIARFERGCNKVDWVVGYPSQIELESHSHSTLKIARLVTWVVKEFCWTSKVLEGTSPPIATGSKRFVEKGDKIDTDEASALAQGCFDDKSREMDASVGEEPKSSIVTARETFPTSALQSQGKHLDIRPRTGLEYIVCEEIVSTRKLNNGDEDDPKVDDILSSSEVKEHVDGAHKHVESINLKSPATRLAKVNSSIKIYGDNADNVRHEGDDGFFEKGVSDVERAVRDIETVTGKVPLILTFHMTSK